MPHNRIDRYIFDVRSFAGDFFTLIKIRMDEALFILILLGVTIFQTLVMIRPWAGFSRDLMIDTGASYDSVRFILFITVSADMLTPSFLWD
jgi:hypothetical protein